MTSCLSLTDEEFEQIKKAILEAFSISPLKQSEPDKIKDGFYE